MKKIELLQSKAKLQVTCLLCQKQIPIIWGYALGICIIDENRNIYKQGGFDVKFTMQGISKVIALMLALMDNKEKVFENECIISAVNMRQK